MPSNDIQNYEKIEPPAPLEYTEVTEPVAQALQFEAKVFLHVLRCAVRVVKFIFSRENKICKKLTLFQYRQI